MMDFVCYIPSGNLTVCYWKWPFIMDFSIKNSGCSIAMLNYQTVSTKEVWKTMDLTNVGVVLPDFTILQWWYMILIYGAKNFCGCVWKLVVIGLHFYIAILKSGTWGLHHWNFRAPYFQIQYTHMTHQETRKTFDETRGVLWLNPIVKPSRSHHHVIHFYGWCV